MKYLILLSFLFSSVCQATEFHFVFLMPYGQAMQKFEYKTDACTWGEAYERAAKSCTDFFAKRQVIDELRMLDIVDVCANPVKQ